MVNISKACHHEVVNKGRKLISRTNVRIEKGIKDFTKDYQWKNTLCGPSFIFCKETMYNTQNHCHTSS